ncbi:hypothetical protein [Rhizobium sp. BG4]|uniref:hypothetical protein n=1 Tax=Rhizobium sp. BG4 TaxID=2613770 RepID=UPI00193D6FCE|nr:hypothetical protein [Rhizobium sp. BG4]QRM45339.1 hypothetical protein F2982_18975 [Rhizobium sp. BG4]
MADKRKNAGDDQPTTNDKMRDEAIASLSALVNMHQNAITEIGNHLGEQLRAFVEISNSLAAIRDRLGTIEATLGIHAAADETVN